MNRIPTEQTIDQLVHGELAWDDRNLVLQQIEEAPEMWRQLAIAFVEKQMLDEAATTYLNQPQAQPTNTKTLPARTHHSPAGMGPLWTAACILLSICAGIWLNTLWSGPSRPQPTEVVELDEEVGLEDALARCTGPEVELFRRELLREGILIDQTHDLRNVVLPNGHRVPMRLRGYRVEFLGAATYQ